MECGVKKNKPTKPCKVIGTYTFKFTIINPEFNRAMAYLSKGNLKKYLEEVERLSGRVLMESTLRLSFSDSTDFYLPSVDTLLISGRIPWGIRGQDWLMSVNGGTGDYKNATGQGEACRLSVANGSCTLLGESWRICFDKKDLLKHQDCDK
jgi:hypothetical protein